MARRRRIYKSDELVIGPYRISGEDVRMMLNPRARALWGLCERDGRLTPVMYTEDRVIWTMATDWEHSDVEV